MASQPMGNILQVHAEMYIKTLRDPKKKMPVKVQTVCRYLSMLKRGRNIIKDENDLAECDEIEKFWTAYLQSRQQNCPKESAAAD